MGIEGNDSANRGQGSGAKGQRPQGRRDGVFDYVTFAYSESPEIPDRNASQGSGRGDDRQLTGMWLRAGD
jgi:hypothetical protein